MSAYDRLLDAVAARRGPLCEDADHLWCAVLNRGKREDARRVVDAIFASPDTIPALVEKGRLVETNTYLDVDGDDPSMLDAYDSPIPLYAERGTE